MESCWQLWLREVIDIECRPVGQVASDQAQVNRRQKHVREMPPPNVARGCKYVASGSFEVFWTGAISS